MKLWLQELQEANSKIQKVRQQKPDGYKKIDEIPDYQYSLLVFQAI